ncbi:MAG: fimbrillin family protein, partial [Tannerella sp.]|nr:fimbrillin family protein [Tannerella sp.]
MCLFVAMIFYTLVSCADLVVEKEDLVSEVYKNPAFRVGDVVTYTSLGSDLKILWQEGDQIGIFCTTTAPAAVNERAILNSLYAGQPIGIFNSDLNWGSSTHKFYVYYPWRKEAGTVPESLKHVIQTVQTQKGSNNSLHIGKNAFLYARSNGEVPGGAISLEFKHTTCIFEISFKSDFPEVQGKALTKIVLKANNGATLSGDYTIDIKNNSTSTPVFSDTNKSDSIVLYLTDAYMPDNSTDSLKAYLVANPANMENAIIKYTVDGEEYTLTKAVNRQLEAKKVYKVMTKVDYGVISATPQVVYLSPVHPAQSVTIESTHPWKFVDAAADCAVATFVRGVGETFTLTRKTSQTDFTVFGNSTVKLTTEGENPKSTSVRVENLFLSVPEPLYIGNPVGADTTVYIPDIVAFGGEGKFVVESFTGEWIQSMEYDEMSRKLKAKVLHNSTNTDRPGTVTVRHFNDPDYKVTVQILQNEFVYVPEFKFFVLDIQWCKRSSLDVDIAYVFENNSPVPPFENKAVGWSLNSYVTYNSVFLGNNYRLVNWGGDATQGQGETVYFDAEAFNGATDVPRYLNMGLYLTWFNHGHSSESWDVRVTLSC